MRCEFGTYLPAGTDNEDSFFHGNCLKWVVNIGIIQRNCSKKSTRCSLNNQYICFLFITIMKFPAFVLILSCIMLSCGENTDQLSKPDTIKDTTAIFGNSGFVFPQISDPVKTQILKWGVFEEFMDEAQKVSGSTFEGLRITSERLVEYSDSLVKKIPDTLNTKPINSRLVVMKTRVALLHQTAQQSRFDSLALQQNIREFNTAVSNLIIQLNEKFLKDEIDFQRKDNEESELKKQQRFRDSVFKIELQDKNN